MMDTPLERGSLVQAIQHHLRCTLGREPAQASVRDLYRAVALVTRELAVEQMLKTERRYREADVKRAYYLSMEFLIGRSLGNNLINLGLYERVDQALRTLGSELGRVEEAEGDAALGNGGLGRLAACFLDSLATLGLPGYGYGINYQYGMFKQEIDNGYQRERPDYWLRQWSPWQIERSDETCIVPVEGRIEHAADRGGHYNPMWLDWRVLIGLPFDMPIIGYGGTTVNTLRLYAARSSDEFDMGILGRGDYMRAVEQKVRSEMISKVLYPPDRVEEGKELRLLQEYFFVFCAVHDILERYSSQDRPIERLADKVAIHLNDTHPALAVAELMRVLVDQHDVEWDSAWRITQATCAYTNHTLLPEALEKWPVSLIEHVLPRHMQVIYEINRRFLGRTAEVWPEDHVLQRRTSLIEEGTEKLVRMANLAIVGSHSVNGVARLHSELITTSLVPEFYRIWPERFNNKTNGVTQRRWLLQCNPALARLISENIGDGWITDLDQLHRLEPLAEDSAFRQRFAAIKQENKQRLSQVIADEAWVEVDPQSLFDVQVKRIHEYKRQLLNVMHVVHLYLSVVEDGEALTTPRTCIFAGKAAPGYWAAKQVIKLIHSVAKVVNADPRCRDQLRLVFLPDYRVSLAERIIPAADLSEQISTAGMEASGTGNMKFALNGALTIGTLDGANIEIMEEVGAENIFIFGHTAAEIAELRASGGYSPQACAMQDQRLGRVVDALSSDLFCNKEPGIFGWIKEMLLRGGDYYYHLADLPSYIGRQAEAAREYGQRQRWLRKAVLNVARTGKFSSDRTIRQYATEIWGMKVQGRVIRA
jgi:starch phosphorylase